MKCDACGELGAVHEVEILVILNEVENEANLVFCDDCLKTTKGKFKAQCDMGDLYTALVRRA